MVTNTNNKTITYDMKFMNILLYNIQAWQGKLHPLTSAAPTLPLFGNTTFMVNGQNGRVWFRRYDFLNYEQNND
jgi:hypothetical protein